MDKYTINNSSSLVEAHVSFPHELEYYKYWSKIVRLFSGVKRLSVQNWWFKVCMTTNYLLGCTCLKKKIHLVGLVKTFSIFTWLDLSKFFLFYWVGTFVASNVV